MKRVWRLLCVLATLGYSAALIAQPVVLDGPAVAVTDFIVPAHAAMAHDDGPLHTAPSAIGLTILNNPTLSFTSINDYMNGVSIEQNTLQLSISIGLGWNLQVRATDDLRYQTQSIPVGSIGMQAVSVGTKPEIFLTTNNQTLASGLAASLLNAIMLIRYRVPNGSAFLKPAGTYTTTLIFTCTAQ